MIPSMEDEARRVGPWLRRTSAALTAWCAFWGLQIAVFTVMTYAVLLWGGGMVGSEELGEVAGLAYVGLLWACAGALAFFTTRWQWRRMQDSAAGDHYRLVAVLVVAGIALAPQLFIYTIF